MRLAILKEEGLLIKTIYHIQFVYLHVLEIQ